jgi:hypothetical protein
MLQKQNEDKQFKKYQIPTICSSMPTTMIKLPIPVMPLIPQYIIQSVVTQLGIMCGS